MYEKNLIGIRYTVEHLCQKLQLLFTVISTKFCRIRVDEQSVHTMPETVKNNGQQTDLLFKLLPDSRHHRNFEIERDDDEDFHISTTSYRLRKYKSPSSAKLTRSKSDVLMVGKTRSSTSKSS